MSTVNQVWEYKVITLGGTWSDPKDADIEQTLNQHGQDGWEVFSVVSQYGTNRVRAYARRQLDPEARGDYRWAK